MSTPKSLAEFKRIVKSYKCELLHSLMGPVPHTSHLFGLKRSVVKQQSNSLQFEGGSWFYFPKASLMSFEPCDNGFLLKVEFEDSPGKYLLHRYTKED
jgi:hypothetical protein